MHCDLDRSQGKVAKTLLLLTVMAFTALTCSPALAQECGGGQGYVNPICTSGARRCCAENEVCLRGVGCCDYDYWAVFDTEDPDRRCCAPPKVKCGAGRCCLDGELCIGNGNDVWSAYTCCPRERTCHSECCPAGMGCSSAGCCPTGQICGTSCCGAGQRCQRNTLPNSTRLETFECVDG